MTLWRVLAKVERSAPLGPSRSSLAICWICRSDAAERTAALGARGRSLVVLQVLDPDEIDLPYSGPVRLQSLESDLVVDTDAPQVRAEYQAALQRLRESFERELVQRGGRFLFDSTAEAPAGVVRRVLGLVAGGQR